MKKWLLVLAAWAAAALSCLAQGDHTYIKQLIDERGAFRIVSMTETKGDIVVFGDNEFYTTDGVPEKLLAELQRIQNKGIRIVDVQHTDKGSWIVVYGKNDYFKDERDDCTVTWLVPNGQKYAMEPIGLTLPKGGVSQEIKTHEGEEFAYVVKGKVILEDLTNGKEYHLRTGETFYTGGEFVHRIRNGSDKEASVLWISSPSVF